MTKFKVGDKIALVVITDDYASLMKGATATVRHVHSDDIIDIVWDKGHPNFTGQPDGYYYSSDFSHATWKERYGGGE